MEKVQFTLSLKQFKPIFQEWIKEVLSEINISSNSDVLREVDIPINIKDVSELTGLTVSTIYRYCQRKEIPYYKKAHRLFFFKSELIGWVESGKQKTLKELESDAEGYLSKKKSNQLKLF
jgi:predicted DNA-binding transcriptional regulator AlpA